MPDEATLLTVQIRLAKSADSFADLLMLAAGLYQVDMLASYANQLGAKYYSSRSFGFNEPYANRAQIKSFQISSLPDLSIYCRPEWLTLYVCMYGTAWQTVATYDAFVKNLPRLRSDVLAQLEKVTGASNKLKAAILKHAAVFFDGLLDLPEQDLLFLLVHLQEARRLLSLIAKQDISSDDLKILDESTDSIQSEKED